MVENLLPKKSYTSYVRIYPAGGGEIVSNEVSFTTMDTTSHYFTWQVFEFGNFVNSFLYDVAIISENDIWAVGEIYVADTNINGYTTYNAVHWDGNKWELKKIYTYSNCSSIDYAPLRSIFAFSSNNIVVTSGGGMWWYDGIRWKSECTINPLLTGAINKLWGKSSSDLFAVGDNGNIFHWDGKRWAKIESGTNVDINDVFGVINKRTNRRIVFCSVSNLFERGGYKILTIDENNKVDTLPWGQDRRINSTWSSNGWIVYTSGGGVFHNKKGKWVEEKSIPLYYTNRVRGNGLNDIFVVGDFALLVHYNGYSWRVYQEFLQLPFCSFNSISVSENIIAIVGYLGTQALIIIGRRNDQ